MPVSLQSQIGGKQQADQALAESISSKIRVAIPGVIQSFDPDAAVLKRLTAVTQEPGTARTPGTSESTNGALLT